MKNYYILFATFSFLLGNAQDVGINTKNPKAKLDINGNLIIQTVTDATPINSYNFLVLDPSTNEVQKINRSFDRNSSIAKVSKQNSTSLLGLTTSGTWQKINFDVAAIDLGSNFDSTDDHYTVPSTGLYQINYYFRYGEGISASLLGTVKAGIFKQVGTANPIKLDQKGFSGVNVVLVEAIKIGNLIITPEISVGITISSTTINSVYQLNAGDKITFELDPNGLGLTLLSSSRAEFVVKKISD